MLELFDLVPRKPSRADLGASAQELLTLLGDGPLSADEIARAAGIEPASLAASLMELELGRRVTLEDGVYRAAILVLAPARLQLPLLDPQVARELEIVAVHKSRKSSGNGRGQTDRRP